MAKMNAISLYQPWASWIAEGIKTVETRTHDRFRSLVGQRIAIHAGLKTDPIAWLTARLFLTNQKREAAFKIWTGNFPTGAIVCTAYVSGFSWIGQDGGVRKRCEGEALIDCHDTERCGLWLEGIHKLEKPIPCKGRQGIFKVEAPE
jgi:ASCH domain.